MSKGIGADLKQVEIIRVQNGWVVVEGFGVARGPGPFDGKWIARTPKELGDLLVEWAQRQQDQPT